jgi:hypothetical protein
MRKIFITLAVLIAIQATFSGCLFPYRDHDRDGHRDRDRDHDEHHQEHGDHN